ncbi:MAG: hypothetical protein HGA63_00720 [Syntrophobacteraceae bacterium]|nr:hypothetical protein [Syntrophobacteraceae bacterium]
MGFSAHDDLLDNGPKYLKDYCTKVTLCNAQPTTYSDANTLSPTGMKLAEVTLTTTDFSMADGDTSGRKVVMAAKTGITPGANGTATHMAFLDTNNSKLLLVKQISSQVLSTSQSITIPSNRYEVRDPILG